MARAHLAKVRAVRCTTAPAVTPSHMGHFREVCKSNFPLIVRPHRVPRRSFHRLLTPARLVRRTGPRLLTLLLVLRLRRRRSPWPRRSCKTRRTLPLSSFRRPMAWSASGTSLLLRVLIQTATLPYRRSTSLSLRSLGSLPQPSGSGTLAPSATTRCTTTTRFAPSRRSRSPPSERLARALSVAAPRATFWRLMAISWTCWRACTSPG